MLTVKNIAQKEKNLSKASNLLASTTQNDEQVSKLFYTKNIPKRNVMLLKQNYNQHKTKPRLADKRTQLRIARIRAKRLPFV